MSSRSRPTKRYSQSTSSIGNAMAAIDVLFDQSDEDNIMNDKLRTLRENEVQETDAIPVHHGADANSEEFTSQIDNYTPTFNIDDDDIFDLVAEVDKADAEHQKKQTINIVHDDDDDDDDIKQTYEEQAFSAPLTKSIKRGRKRTLSDATPKTLEKEIISSILDKLKLAITFLLHAKSPLHHSDDHQASDCDSSENMLHIAWLHEYNDNIKKEDIDLEMYAMKINLLYQNSDKYKSKHKEMHKTWRKWQRYTLQTAQEIDIKQHIKASRALMQQHESFLEDIADDFILAKSITKKEAHSLISSFGSTHRSHTTMKDDQLITMATTRMQNRDLNNKTSLFDSMKNRGDFGEFAMDLTRSADILPSINSRQLMKEWIEKYKTKQDLSKACMNCGCCNRQYTEDAGQTELDITSPMTTWSWLNVVAFIEASEELRHLAAVFWQYKINGLELCKMGATQMELLVECSILSDQQFVESDFDQLKTRNKHEWLLTIDGNKFEYYKDKVRIESHVIAQYNLAMDILHDVIYNTLEDDADGNDYKEFYQDFGLISDILEILRAEHILGSKLYWKEDAYFFDKIDNYLAILLSEPLILAMYHKFHYDFLVAPDKPPADYVYTLMAKNKQQQELMQTNQKSSTRINNIQSASQINDSVKYITTQLNMMYTLSRDTSIRRRKCTELFMERFCCEFVSSSINTIYIPLLCLTVISLLSTSLFTIIWFYSHGSLEQTGTMHMTIDALAERTHNSLVDEFWVPQFLISTAIGALYSGDLTINAATSNGSYDAYFIAFSNMNRAESIFSLGLYNSDDNTLLMAYRNDDAQMIITNFNGSCRTDTEYKDNTAAAQSIDCDYDPVSRPWYQLATENINKAIWTEPYLFAEGYFGMSLVAAFAYEDTLIIFLCEMRLDILQNLPLLRTKLPQGSVVMLASSELDIIASSANQVYLTNGEQTNDPLIVASVEYMKAQTDEEQDNDHHRVSIDEKGYTLSIFPFHLVYVNFIPSADLNGSMDNIQLIKPLIFNNSDDYQFGYILIANDDTYLENVNLAFLISQIALGFILITTISLICLNMKYHDMNLVGHAMISANSATNKRISNENIEPKRPLSNPLNVQSVELSKPKQREESAYSAVSYTNTEIKAVSPFAHQRSKQPKMGDFVKTKDGKQGTITHITKLLEDASFALIGLQLINGKTVFTNRSNIISQHEEPLLPPITETKTKGTRNHSQSSSKRWQKAKSHSVHEQEHKYDNEQEQDPPQATAAAYTETQESARAPQEDIKKGCLQLTQQQLIVASFVQNFVLVFFLIIMWAFLLTSARLDLAENILAKTEWRSVKDQVMHLSEKAEMVLSLYTDRFERGTFDIDNDENRDRFLANIMQSMITSEPALYSLHYTYLGTPDGRFLGVGWQKNETNYVLRNGIRSKDTDWALTEYTLADDATYLYPDDPITQQVLYDPRCRIWYQNAMQFTFNGSINEAFPSNHLYNVSFDDFVMHTDALKSSNCASSRTLFADMFNISLSENTREIISTQHAASYSYDASNDTEQGTAYTLVWSRYIFYSLGQIGLTASAAIQDPVSGDLFGVLGVDFTLGQLSSLLYSTIASSTEVHDSNDWFAWIYDATDINRPEMIASSEFQILKDFNSNIEGCISIEESTSDDVGSEAKVPYYATSHPQERIAIASEEINVTGIDLLSKYRNSSVSIGVPINFPMLEAGRISFFPGGRASVDWILAKTMNDLSINSVDSIQVTFFVCFTILVMALFLVKEFDFVDVRQEEEEEELHAQFDDDKKDINYYYRLMLRMRSIVLGSANVAWKLMIENTHNNSYSKQAVPTSRALQFMADRANEHIAAENENELKFIECAWESALQSEFHRSRNKKQRIFIFRFIESNLYGIFNQFFLILHLVTSLFEPATPKQLREEALSSWILLTIGICIIMEWFDVFLRIYRRYIEFSIAEPFLTQLYEINYGIKHKYTKCVKYASANIVNKLLKRAYLVFFGPRFKIFVIHCTLNGAILFNFITRIVWRTGYLSYYFPVLPFLLLIRNETVLKFSADFIFAVLYCKDVLFSYMCFILVFAVFSMSLFRSVVNEARFNESFENITQALITAFVYISTSENYTFMYDVFDASYYRKHGSLMLINATSISLLFAMIGLFIFVPMIIHRFELAFEERRIFGDFRTIASKENAIIAAFIMLDMNGDLDIDKNEFQSLLTSSMFDDININAGFAAAGIDINGFVQHLLAQTFRHKIMSSSVPQQNKLRAWLECNIIRHRLYKIWVLIICVLTFLMASLLGGLQVHHLYNIQLNYTLYILFIINMAEIHFVIFVYGAARYCDLNKFANPNYVAAAINNYQARTRNNNQIEEISKYRQNSVRLTSSQRIWVAQHLSDVRPLSILEKSTLTLIHRLQLAMIWGTGITFIGAKLYFYVYYSSDSDEWSLMNEQYAMYFIQAGVLIRLFFLIPINRKLIWVIFSVFPQFLSLFAFLGLFMYGYARIGCTLFGDDITDIVTDSVYPQSAAIKAKFNNLPFAMLALLQLMVGEGWHELMYFNVIATHPLAAVYFIAYITAVTIIISNVFVGLFLAEIDQLNTQQANDDILINSNKTESFEKYANKRLNILNYQIKMNRKKTKKMQNQIDQIELLLYHQKLNLVQNSTIMQ